MSTRISNSSAYENSEQPTRSVSVSPSGGRKPSSSSLSIDRAALPLGSQAISDLFLVNQSGEDNINDSTSRFSFVPSYANSSAGASQVGENLAEDGQEISRFGSVSTSSEYPPGTSKKVKSPPPGNKPHGDSEGNERDKGKGALLPFGIQLDTFEFDEEAPIEDGIMVAGESERGSKMSLPLAKKVTRKEVGSPPKGREAKDNAPEIVIQSPKTPAFSHVKEEPKSPRAEKALRVPFLHRFRRNDSKVSAAADSSSATADTAANALQHREPHSHQQVSSFFDAPSSDGEEDEEEGEKEENTKGDGHAFLGNAQQASFRRPVLVNHSTSTPLGLKDILHRGPSARSQNVSPLSGGGDHALQRRTLEDESNKVDERKKESRRSGVIGWPASEHAIDGPQTAGLGNTSYESGDDRVSGLWGGKEGPNPFASGNKAATAPAEIGRQDGLRSHPTVKSPKRQVTFPIETQIGREKAWVREDMTPYPVDYKSQKENMEETEESKGVEQAEKKASLIIVVYTHHNRVPKVKQLHVPTVAHEIPILNPSKSAKSPSKAIMNRNFDDATLFTLLRSTYTSLRGTWTAKFSARTVCSIRLLGYEKTCQLATNRAKRQCFENKDEEAGFAEAQLIELYKQPRQGKGHWEWWSWVRGLPENQAAELEGRVALELVEGWSVRRILLALALVAVCSLLAMLLWIFAGTASNSNSLTYPPSHAVAVGLATPKSVEKATTKRDEAITASPTTSGPLTAGAPLEASFTGIFPEIPVPAPGMQSRNEIEPTVKQRNAVTASGSDLGFMSASTALTASADENVDSHTPTPLGRSGLYSVGGPGSRVGVGVALGVLVLLFGWMIVGGWVVLSWMVG